MSDVSMAEGQEAGFAEGFDGTPPASAAKVVEQPKVEADPKVAGDPEKPSAPPEKPVYARVLKQDWDNAKAAIGKVANLESQLAKLTGVEDRIEKVRSQTPSGLSVEMSDEDFAELAEEFPELAKSTRSVLEKVFKKASIKGTGPAEPAKEPPSTGVDPDAVKTAVARALAEREEGALNEEFPDWGTIIGRPAVDGGKPPEGNAFRAWLEKQDPAYQKKIAETMSHADIHNAIRRFQATQKPTPEAVPDKGAARRAVMEAAVTPRVDKSPPALPKAKTEEEAFAEGYQTG
ncbi:MAG TPA: hypothetical protein VFO41_08765 [Alphaproteobacteria bacterium]|nr:hypothetical protein [Alphaproteobacteria bacterium]